MQRRGKSAEGGWVKEGSGHIVVRWDKVAQQLLGALRANRSQRELSRLAGYRSNVLCNWEARRRFPTAERTLAMCATLGIDTVGALAKFAPECAGMVEGFRLDRWLSSLRDRTTLVALAHKTGISRFAIGRWLRGKARPRLPEFLCLVHAMTGRVTELVHGLVRRSDMRELVALEQELVRGREVVAAREERRWRLRRCRAELALGRMENRGEGDWFESASVSGADIERAGALLRDVAAQIRRMAAATARSQPGLRRAIVNLQLVDWTVEDGSKGAEAAA